MSRRSSALWSLPLARRTSGTKVSPACFGSGAVSESFPHSTHEGRGEWGAGERKVSRAAARHRPRQVSRLSAIRHSPHLFWDCTPLRPRLGSHHTMFRSLSSGRVSPQVIQGATNGQRTIAGRRRTMWPEISRRLHPRSAMLDAASTSQCVSSSRQVGDNIWLFYLAPGGSGGLESLPKP
ncbi:hypothetical protein NDU88_002798 [Pleurodeles waltl]|uniref:Uncharacterized protein n=1 Tax=Pleurodeles waltl TaxID=8319 RepID=A0AAV7UY49_PLEWA|nr:hypothetical protein NDU88_002798 [Pleurodeles waltl]